MAITITGVTRKTETKHMAADNTIVDQNLKFGVESPDNGYFAKHTYAPGSYQMRISDNLSAI